MGNFVPPSPRSKCIHVIGVGLYLLKENFMWPTFKDETHVLSFLFYVLSFLFVKVTF